MLLNNVIDIFEKFKVSWFSTGLLTVSPAFDFMPLISQIVLVLSLQIISIMVDYVRNRLKLRSRTSSDLELPETKNNSFDVSNNETFGEGKEKDSYR